MAGNIQGFTLAQVQAKCEEYNQKLNQINILDLQLDFTKLTQHWTGKVANSVIEKYNSIIDELYFDYLFFKNTARNILREIYLQYENMENKGVAQDITIEIPDAMPSLDIDLTSPETIKFDQEQVISITNNITDNLDNMEIKFKEMVGILDDLSSCSDSLNSLVTKYNAHAENIVSSVKTLKDELKSCVSEAVKTVQTAEGYNENDASRIQQTKD